MSYIFEASNEVKEIRGQIDHPIIDGDGHFQEFMPIVAQFVGEIGGGDLRKRFEEHLKHLFTRWGFAPVGMHSWGIPGSTLDRMTPKIPKLLHSRLDELGLDYAVLYPSMALPLLTVVEPDLRRVCMRALNTYSAELFAGYKDRLCPVAAIPTWTPEEAVDELEYAVRTLGHKAVTMSGVIPRKVRPDGTELNWIDSLGHGSLYNYDPMWAKCAELKVVPTFHANGYGWGSRVSLNNYVYNHIGSFAAAQEAVCRSLVMGGVPKRFPTLNFGFLEGGVGWSAQLYHDLLGHFEKRNKDALMEVCNPAGMNLAEAAELVKVFGQGRVTKSFDAVMSEAKMWGSLPLPPQGLDEFAESGITKKQDIRDIFTRQFYFGCEADDAMNAVAFNRPIMPKRIPIPAFFASDISHWDVPDMRGVLPEAWELVEHELITKDDFREFTCGNIVRLFTGTNPKFFEGTAVADAVKPHMAPAR